MSRARVDPAWTAAALLGAVVLAMLGPAWLSGRTTYWIDLTYLHHGWRAAPAMLIAAGRAPLWEPSLYFGMPMAGSMQGGLFHPFAVFYWLFGFATATALFQAANLLVAGWLCALWLRSWRLSWGASLGGAVVFAFSGVFVARLPYLNHLSTLAWAPALLLFFRRPVQLALTLALMVLAGYPLFIPGLALAAWTLAFAARRGRVAAGDAVNWAGAAALSACLSAVQLLPGLELAAHSRRAGGVALDEALNWGFSPRDLAQWIGPLAVGWGNFKPADQWWLCVYLGVAGAFAVAAGFAAAPRRRAAVLAAWLAFVVVLCLGASNPLSAALWRVLPPLKFVRYPGNLAYLALPALAALAAAGFSARRTAPLLVLAACVELVVIGRLATPTAPRELFTSPGELVRALQQRLDGARYLISPRALQASTGTSVLDWRQRLYGLTNAPFRLRAAANFGEPLVPAGSYAAMDAMLSLKGGADAAAAWMPWLGATRLLTPGPAASPRLEPEGLTIWNVSRLRGPSATAWKLGEKEGAALPADWPAAPPALGAPLAEERPREDRFSVSGEGAGWLFVAEPLYPGWCATYSVDGSPPSRVEPMRAIVAFQKLKVGEGKWTVRWKYEPVPWRIGLLLTWGSLLALGASWYHRSSAVPTT